VLHLFQDTFEHRGLPPQKVVTPWGDGSKVESVVGGLSGGRALGAGRVGQPAAEIQHASEDRGPGPGHPHSTDLESGPAAETLTLNLRG